MSKQVTLTLPEGITDVRLVDEPMIGTMLDIEFANGYRLRIDALALGDRECEVVLIEDSNEDDERPVASIAFDQMDAPVVWTEKR